MPYYHIKDNGRIHFWRRKCSICGRKWPISALFSLNVPEGMTRFRPVVKVPGTKEGKATYANWADRIPGVGFIARKLPNWPRWARILAVVTFIGLIIVVVYLIRG